MAIDTTALLASFKENGGWYDERIFGLKPFDNMGIGAVALEEIKEDEPLFSIPDTYLLTPNTSKLASLLSAEHWESLGDGWAPLILAMMWEESRGAESPWFGYMKGMPVTFDTPMFWSDEEKLELQGTDLMDRIGKEQAEADYHEKVTPVLKVYPAVFSSPEAFSLEQYHLQGSRILSRSFTVPLSRAGKPFHPKSSMEVDPEQDEDEEDEEEEVAVMVPMADMLNAAYELDNARLFHEDDCLKMVATKTIAKGEQIYNTYGSPPNSQLLRKYGHVDVLPLSEDVLERLPKDSETRRWAFGNPGDEVEIPGDMIVRAIVGEGKEADVESRVEWWLEEGEDDSFPLTYDSPLSDELIAFVRLLSSHDDWERAEKKGKTPKPLVDKSVVDILKKVVSAREAMYTTKFSDDIDTLESSFDTVPRKTLALVVRVGERRILAATKHALQEEEETLKAQAEVAKRDKKRKAQDEGKGSKRGGKVVR